MSFKEIHANMKESRDKKLAYVREIVDLRNTLQMTQRSFANLLGVSTRTVEAWEIGKCNPSQTALNLMRLLRLQPSLVHTLNSFKEDMPHE